MKFIDLNYLDALADDQSLMIGERFELTTWEIAELKRRLMEFYEECLEDKNV